MQLSRGNSESVVHGLCVIVHVMRVMLDVVVGIFLVA